MLKPACSNQRPLTMIPGTFRCGKMFLTKEKGCKVRRRFFAEGSLGSCRVAEEGEIRLMFSHSVFE